MSSHKMNDHGLGMRPVMIPSGSAFQAHLDMMGWEGVR